MKESGRVREEEKERWTYGFVLKTMFILKMVVPLKPICTGLINVTRDRVIAFAHVVLFAIDVHIYSVHEMKWNETEWNREISSITEWSEREEEQNEKRGKIVSQM